MCDILRNRVEKKAEDKEVDEKKYESIIHHIMSFVGGFLGGFAIFNFSHTFGSSETSNMIYLVQTLLGKDFIGFVIRMVALFIYSLGLIFTIVIPKFSRVNLKIVSVIINFVGFIALSFMPTDIDYMIFLYPVFFMSAFQWNVFEECGGYRSATIFLTNNLRQTVLSYVNYFFEKDREFLNKAIFFTLTLAFFLAGVAYSYYVAQIFAERGAIFGAIPNAAALFFILKEQMLIDKEEQEEEEEEQEVELTK